MANETTITTTVVVAVISALMGGTGMTLLNYFFNRKKVEAEIQKMKAETNKIYLEIKNLSDTVSYSLSDYSEKILFDARNKIDGFDIKGHEGQFWKDNKRIGEIGRGYLRFEEGGVFNIQRTNTEGRFEIQLIRYIYNGNENNLIPKDELISGKRKLRISCDAKTTDGEHTLRFIVRNVKDSSWLANETVKVIGNEWTQYQVYLQFDPTQDLWLRIDDENISIAPSSIQIRNLVVAERK